MKFTQADLENISKNFKHIRLACGYKTQEEFAWALDPADAKFPGFSLDMIKKYESGKYQISEQTVRAFSSLFGFTLDQIVFDDLSHLKPNSLVFKSFSFKDVLSDEQLAKVISEEINAIFPLFKNDISLEDCNFSKAFDLSINKLSSVATVVTKAEEYLEALGDAIEGFEEADSPESLLNIMSLLGRYYVLFMYQGLEKETAKKLISKRYINYVDFRKDFYSCWIGCNNAAFKDGFKREFLDSFDADLFTCMEELAAIDEHKDYIYYYLAVRYYFGMMNNEATKMSDTEMNSFGISLLDSFEKIGNKYAKTFNKSFLRGHGASSLH